MKILRILWIILLQIFRIIFIPFLPFIRQCCKQIQWIWDRMYVHSTFLQKIFSYRLGEYNLNTIHTARELCLISGLSLQTHKTFTQDGYEIILHNCRRRNSSSDDYSHSTHAHGPPVLLVHGLMQDAESFLCGGSTSLVSHLVNAGYDVWIGNNRGTKYSSNHLKYNRDHQGYWDYCIDDLAAYDVPAMIEYVLQATNSSQIAYVGFSQGSTQGFASLFSKSKLQSQVSLFIALSPALKSSGLSSFWLQKLLHTFPHLLFHVFGRHGMLSFCEDVRQVLSKSFFANIVKYAMNFLFHWNCENITSQRRVEFFQFCYSPSSVKCVNHWFQIIQHGSFRSYRHEIDQKGASLRKGRTTDTASRQSQQQQSQDLSYDLRKPFNCPVAIFYGGSDTLITRNIHEVLEEMSGSIKFLHCEPSYEHLDMIWADNAHEKIFPKMIEQLEKYHQTRHRARGQEK
jgi:lysosomal acid lipase/cholesteryl ester hydrolase